MSSLTTTVADAGKWPVRRSSKAMAASAICCARVESGLSIEITPIAYGRPAPPLEKKPTWWNTQGYSTMSAYSATGPPVQPGYPSSSRPTTLIQVPENRLPVGLGSIRHANCALTKMEKASEISFAFLYVGLRLVRVSATRPRTPEGDDLLRRPRDPEVDGEVGTRKHGEIEAAISEGITGFEQVIQSLIDLIRTAQAGTG